MERIAERNRQTLEFLDITLSDYRRLKFVAEFPKFDTLIIELCGSK